MDYLEGMNDAQRIAYKRLRKGGGGRYWHYDHMIGNGYALVTYDEGKHMYQRWYMDPDGNISNRVPRGAYA